MADAFRRAMGQPSDATLVSMSAPSAGEEVARDASALTTGEFLSQQALDVATDRSPVPDEAASTQASSASTATLGAAQTAGVRTDGGTSTTLASSRGTKRRWYVAPLAVAAAALALGGVRYALTPEPAAAVTEVVPSSASTSAPDTRELETTAPSATSLTTAQPSASAAAQQPETAGEREVTAVLAGAKAQLDDCYQGARRNNPSLTGTLSIALILEESGELSDLVVTGMRDRGLRNCVRDEVEKLAFPRPAEAVAIVYPVVFGVANAKTAAVEVRTKRDKDFGSYRNKLSNEDNYFTPGQGSAPPTPGKKAKKAQDELAQQAIPSKPVVQPPANTTYEQRKGDAAAKK
jgi:hypothetical protein